MKNYTQKIINSNKALSIKFYNYWLNELNTITNKDTNTYLLDTEKDTALSFYGKALITQATKTINGATYSIKLLTSYDTKICFIIKNLTTGQTNIYFNSEFWTDENQTSNTTLRHIKEFIYQSMGKDALTKTDLLKLKHLNYGLNIK